MSLSEAADLRGGKENKTLNHMRAEERAEG